MELRKATVQKLTLSEMSELIRKIKRNGKVSWASVALYANVPLRSAQKISSNFASISTMLAVARTQIIDKDIVYSDGTFFIITYYD